MDKEILRDLILSKVSRMRRLDIERKIFDILQESPVGLEFIEEHLNSYSIEDPIKLISDINDIMSRETSMGFLFQDLLKITSDKIGMGEVLLSLCIKDATSGGTEDTDIIVTPEKTYEVKKISKGGIFNFSERFTEYNDLGLIMNMAILNFGAFNIFEGKNLYTVSTGEIRKFKKLIEKFLLPSEKDMIPFHSDQFVVKVNGIVKVIENNTLKDPGKNDRNLEAYYSMFNFRDQVLNSKIKKETLTLFKGERKDKYATKKMINNLFSTTTLRQILKGIDGVFLVLPDFSLSYFTPHPEMDSLYPPEEISIYSISRNKMNFKGPFLKSSRGEKNVGELPQEFLVF